VLLGSLPHSGALAVGEFYDGTLTVRLPKHVSGELFITPWSDAYDAIPEDTFSANVNPDDPTEADNNNYKARPITVLLTPPPDPAVTSVTPLPQALVSGNPLTVRWSVQNQGTGETEDAVWVDQVYVSDLPSLDAPGARKWFLGSFRHDGSLAPGQSYTAEQTVVLSPAVTGRYVIVVTNTGGGIDEQPIGKTWGGAHTRKKTRTAPAGAPHPSAAPRGAP